MEPTKGLTRIVNRVLYSVDAATLLADDAWWDGHNYERNGRNMYLYRTPNGLYFLVNLSQWEDEQYERIEPVSLEDAIYLYEEVLLEHEVDYAAAFPGVVVKDA